jgi:uncharacterized protein involved in exopolysaccharide biosynthesis
MQDPLVSAQIAQFTQKYITQYATTYSISKSKEQLSFIELQCNERRVEFEQTQLNLAQFRDRNRNINTSQAKSEEERLQSEYNLAFNVYNQLAQQRETIRLKVNENTPIFTVLEPARIPVEESKPKKLIILIAFFFGSIFLGIFIILGKNILVKLNL